jgi:methylmalonyl-CoA/ethylmalonyl-CoA epimerase
VLTHVHHVNFLVRDLAGAIAAWRRLGVTTVTEERLPGRGVETARFQVGATWIVLVMPTDPDGAPGRHLAEHGEGLFLLSLGVPSLDVAARGALPLSTPRGGLANWWVADLDPAAFHGATLQLCEQRPARGDRAPGPADRA